MLLLEDEYVPGPHCRFASDEISACGECAAKSCQTEVDACCASESCAASMSTLDACSTSGDAACVELRHAKTGTAWGALGACVTAKCPYACGPECIDDAACPSGQRCLVGRCRPVCFEDSECAYGSCLVPAHDTRGSCSDPVGTPCGERIGCLDTTCRSKDSEGSEVPGYCTRACYNDNLCPLLYLCNSELVCVPQARTQAITDVCAKHCDKLKQLGCTNEPETCPARCKFGFNGAYAECVDRLLDYFECKAENATNCNDVPGCPGTKEELGGCGCWGSCSGTTASEFCRCTFKCNGDLNYEVICDKDLDCICQINGYTIGYCKESGVAVCDVADGCCAEFFR